MVGGAILYWGFSIPWLSNWLGHLPGDMIVKKGRLLIFVPVTSAILASLVISLFFRK